MKVIVENFRKIKWILLLSLVLIFNGGYGQNNSDVIKLFDSQLIWNKARHNAFTTLESYDGYLYCAFREGTSHKSFDGKIRIIRSKDGTNWSSVSLINIPSEDLRDPKLVSNEENLILIFVSRTASKHYSYTFSSSDGMNWSSLEKSENSWRWNAEKKGNLIYSVGYSGNDKLGRLYETTDGKEWESVKTNFFPALNESPSETKIFVTEANKMVALVRQDKGSQSALLGTSEIPYNSWTWKKLGLRIGSPAGIVLNNNELLVCVRMYDAPVRVSFLKINISDGSYKEIISLPSGGDTGYADITLHKDQYFVSYYSSKNIDKKASIYLAKFNIN